MALGDILQGLFGGGVDLLLSQQDFNRIEGIGDTLDETLGGLATTARTNTQFTPFSITGTGGSASATGPDGTFTGLNVNLDPITQALINQGRTDSLAAAGAAGQTIAAPTLTGGGFTAPAAPTLGAAPSITAPNVTLPTAPGSQSGLINLPPSIATALQQAGLYSPELQDPTVTQSQIGSSLLGGVSAGDVLGSIGAGTGRSEADIFQMLEAMQNPDRERERLQLRDELAGQGRLGLQTAQFGGSPEELARAKAVEEARSGNAFRAFQLAGDEQQRLAQQALQAYGIGETSAGRQDQSLLSSFGLGNQGQDIANSLTAALGGLGLQGREIGNRFNLGLLDAALGQRGQDVNALLQGGDIANRFNLGLFGQQSQNALEAARIGQISDQLRLQGQGQQADQLLRQFQIQSQNAATAGQLGLGADELQVGLFGQQLNQQLNQGQIASQLFRDTFLPEQNLLDQLGLGADVFEIAQRADIQGEQIAQNATLNQAENALNIETELARLKQGQNAQLADLLLGKLNSEGVHSGGLLGGIFSGAGQALTDLFTGLFGTDGATYQGPGGT